jgi:hypothetical protein
MGQELALLTGRARPYRYRQTERFLLSVSRLDGDQALTETLARWTTSLWHTEDATLNTSSSHFYLDGHRKPVSTQTLIPRGLIGRSGKILTCRRLTLLHNEQGHPLLATTHRGDLHLTTGIPSLLTRYKQATGALHLSNLVVDREAMTAEFLCTCHEGLASSHFFAYQVASSGAMRPFTSPCVLSTTGNSLVICSSFVSVSMRSSRDFPTADFSFYMRPLHLLAETLLTGWLQRELAGEIVPFSCTSDTGDHPVPVGWTSFPP